MPIKIDVSNLQWYQQINLDFVFKPDKNEILSFYYQAYLKDVYFIDDKYLSLTIFSYVSR